VNAAPGSSRNAATMSSRFANFISPTNCPAASGETKSPKNGAISPTEKGKKKQFFSLFLSFSLCVSRYVAQLVQIVGTQQGELLPRLALVRHQHTARHTDCVCL
jgi:hypothetical protein